MFYLTQIIYFIQKQHSFVCKQAEFLLKYIFFIDCMFFYSEDTTGHFNEAPLVCVLLRSQ